MLARACGNIRRWVEFIIRSKHKLGGLKSFDRELLRDIEAVQNGIRMPWSTMGWWKDMSIESEVLNGRCMRGPALSCCGRK